MFVTLKAYIRKKKKVSNHWPKLWPYETRERGENKHKASRRKELIKITWKINEIEYRKSKRNINGQKFFIWKYKQNG